MEDRGKKSPPIITYTLLAATAILQIYVSTLSVPVALKIYDEYALVPLRLFNGVGAIGLVTHLFLHGSWMHLAVNAIALWGAGGNVEREIGSARYALVYFSSGVVAGIVHSILHTYSEVPLVGSSGAIFGVIAILFLLMPFKVTFALIIPMPSVIVGIILSAIEFSAVWLSSETIVAHDAHLGGFIFGCLCAFAIDKRRALRGLIIAAVILAIMYYLGVYFKLI